MTELLKTATDCQHLDWNIATSNTRDPYNHMHPLGATAIAILNISTPYLCVFPTANL